MSAVLSNCIEKIIVNDCTVFHISLGKLDENETISLIDLIKNEIESI